MNMTSPHSSRCYLQWFCITVIWFVFHRPKAFEMTWFCRVKQDGWKFVPLEENGSSRLERSKYYTINKLKIVAIFLETAINIGYSCHLLSDDMELWIVDGSTQDQVEQQLDQCNYSLLNISERQRSGRNSMATSVVRFRLEFKRYEFIIVNIVILLLVWIKVSQMTFNLTTTKIKYMLWLSMAIRWFMLCIQSSSTSLWNCAQSVSLSW